MICSNFAPACSGRVALGGGAAACCPRAAPQVCTAISQNIEGRRLNNPARPFIGFGFDRDFNFAWLFMLAPNIELYTTSPVAVTARTALLSQERGGVSLYLKRIWAISRPRSRTVL